MKFKKYAPHVLIVLLAVAIAAILWLTLFSRVGSDSRHFYPPFWSYKAILGGSGKALLEDIGNIVLFIPVGVAIALFFRMDVKRCLMIGIGLSVMIESCQWIFWLGSFEIDDLLHNTIGTGIGAALITHTFLGEKFKLGIQKKSLVALFTLVVLLISSAFAYQGLKWHEMKRLATMNDREEGRKNLLFLSPDPVYIGESDFNVAYQSDGSILIEGHSENRAWIEIGRVTLEPGRYSFSGLRGVEEKTIDIELHYFDRQKQQFLRLTKDIGYFESDVFVLNETTKVRAIIGLYPGVDGSYEARPVIYREE